MTPPPTQVGPIARAARPPVVAAVPAAEPDRRWVLAVVLGALTMLGPFTMDLYLPAFPEVQRDLSASQAGVQLTLTATAIGMGVGQIVVGPLSDAFGRRVPLVLATGLHVVASCAVALAPGIVIVAAARFGQGIGASASAVVTVAIIRDLFGGYRLVRMLASIAMIGGLAPLIAPVLGSQLLLVMSWRGVFWLLAGFGLAIVIACTLVVPETLQAHVQGESERVTMHARVRIILADRAFVGVAVIAAMVFATVITYLSTTPFIFQDGFGLDAQQFGLLFAVNALGHAHHEMLKVLQEQGSNLCHIGNVYTN